MICHCFKLDVQYVKNTESTKSLRSQWKTRFVRFAMGELSECGLHKMQVGLTSKATDIMRRIMETVSFDFIRDERGIMGAFKDLTGLVFDRWTVLERLSPSGVKHIYWKCVCSCGNTGEVCSTSLLQGYSKSCGCLASERTSQRCETHGRSKDPIYQIWHSMRDRCENPNNWARKYYIDKGITCSDSWKNFENFLADMGERPEGLTLERIDNLKGYCKENCKWASRHDQRINQDCNTRYSVNGITGTLSQVIEGLGVSLRPSRVHARIQRGWSVEEAFLTPLLTAKETAERRKKAK